jgi:hypothetical protein
MHSAGDPNDLPLQCTAARCRQSDTVPDPFTESCTTGYVLLQLGWRFTRTGLLRGLPRLAAASDRPGRRRSGGRLTSTFLLLYPYVPGGSGTAIRGLA